MVIAMAVMGMPLLVRTARAGFEQVDQRYESVAATLGARPLRVFLTITLPLALPAVAGGAVLSFARAIGEFGATMMVAGSIPGSTRTRGGDLLVCRNWAGCGGGAAGGGLRGDRVSRAVAGQLDHREQASGHDHAGVHAAPGSLRTEARGTPGLRHHGTVRPVRLGEDDHARRDRRFAPASGLISINARVLFDTAAGIDLPPHARHVGYVPQDVALFSHMDRSPQRVAWPAVWTEAVARNGGADAGGGRSARPTGAGPCRAASGSASPSPAR